MNGRGLLESWRRLKRGCRELNKSSLQSVAWMSTLIKPSISIFTLSLLEPLRSFQSFHRREMASSLLFFFFVFILFTSSLPLFPAYCIYIIRAHVAAERS